ncbi:glutaredoxin family protein [Nitrospira sp. BLG_1]|uniref:glutaredoxin family protein n=1 Tax=Nitrospira sp. BLG_1 TaxID=3395883 RepID=UPI0039BC2A85
MSVQLTKQLCFLPRLAIQLFILLLCGWASALPGETNPDIEVFVRAGCPHCEAAKIFLDDLRRERPSLQIALYDIAADSAARQRLETLASDHGVTTIGVPTFVIGTEVLIGFQSADTTGAEILAKLDLTAQGTASQPSDDGIEAGWFGRLRVHELGLPLFTLLIGLLDGFNPCAMWVLLFLLSLLVNLHDRRKIALIAGTFVAVSGLFYFAFMAAWLNMFLLLGFSRAAQITLGSVALLVGAVNIKDFFAFHAGISLSIPESARPGLYVRIRRILQAEYLAGALAGVVVLAGLVNTIELLCTAGFPAVYTQILTMQQLPTWQYYAYLGLYNLAYILDDTVMVTIAVITLSRRKLQEQAGRWLKLASGLVMASLGVILLFHPERLL